MTASNLRCVRCGAPCESLVHYQIGNGPMRPDPDARNYCNRCAADRVAEYNRERCRRAAVAATWCVREPDRCISCSRAAALGTDLCDRCQWLDETTESTVRARRMARGMGR